MKFPTAPSIPLSALTCDVDFNDDDFDDDFNEDFEQAEDEYQPGQEDTEEILLPDAGNDDFCEF